MKRMVIGTDGSRKIKEVGIGFEAWNKAIGASIGQIVPTRDGKYELWVDEEGLCKGEPEINYPASILAGQTIVGNVIRFNPGDIT